MSFIWLNGNFIKNTEDAYGAGIFEKIEISNGKILKLEETLQNLLDKANELLVDILFSFEEFITSCIKLVEHNKIKNGYIYPSFYIKNNEPNFMISCSK